MNLSGGGGGVAEETAGGGGESVEEARLFNRMFLPGVLEAEAGAELLLPLPPLLIWEKLMGTASLSG